METPEDVLIAGHRHLIVHGQLGNLSAKISQLRLALEDGVGEVYLAYLAEIKEELDFLKEVYPALDGGVRFVSVQPGVDAEAPASSEVKQAKQRAIVRACLQDMRALVDAAYTSHTHEGVIDCRLKIMFDVAWESAADAAGIERIDDIPF